MRPTFPLLAVLSGLFLAVSPAAADPAPPAKPGSQCFFVNEFQGWKAPDAKTIYIRVNLHQYYRLDLANTCSALLWPDSHLITHWRGSNSVCSAIDWDLKVAQDATRGFATPCIVKTMTMLSPAEAAAIPRKFKP